LYRSQRGQDRIFNFSAFFAENRVAIQEHLNREIRQSGIPGWQAEVEDPEVMYIENPSSEVICENYELDPNKLFLAYEVVADVNLQFFVYKADYYAMSEDADFEIENSDWNDHYILGSKQLSLPLRISLVLEVGALDRVESFDVELIEFYDWCWNCGTPIRSDAAETCDNCKADLLRRLKRKNITQ
jgi:hypothetical protein